MRGDIQGLGCLASEADDGLLLFLNPNRSGSGAKQELLHAADFPVVSGASLSFLRRVGSHGRPQSEKG